MKSQIKKIKAAKTLKQGSIFDLSKVNFRGRLRDAEKYDGKIDFSFKDLYPYCEYDPNVTKGIIVNQSCDLDLGTTERPRAPKVPYLSVCLLEPISSIIHASQANNPDWTKYFHIEDIGGSQIRIISDEFPKNSPKAITKEFQKLINNNHPWAFFIVFKNTKKGLDLRGVNLTKMFPIRIDHYGQILPHVSHELHNQFENKLGWKLAELYGRVGTEDFSDLELEALTKAFYNSLEDSVSNFVKVPAKQLQTFNGKKNEGKYKGKPELYVEDLTKLMKSELNR